jgi:hypothetical protein
MERQRRRKSEKWSDEEKKKDRKVDGQKDTVIERQSDGQMERQRNRQSEKWSDKERENRETERQTQ